MKMELHIDGQPVTLEKVMRRKQEIGFTLNGAHYSFRALRLPDGSQLLERETAPNVWQRVSGLSWQSGRDGKRIQLGPMEAKITEKKAESAQHGGNAPLSPRAPMPGMVRQILVKPGDRVNKGDPVAVMEAMKLQTNLSAGGNAIVEAILVTEGAMISEGTELVRLSPLKEEQ